MKSVFNYRYLIGVIVIVSLILLSWTRGNHSGDWTKGGTIKVYVSPPPGNAAQKAAYRAAVDSAIAIWNAAQAPFGGLTLQTTTDSTKQDVNLRWKANADSWGSVHAGKNPVQMVIESNDGLTTRGLTRILIHEFGHVEGLGHAAGSALMKANAYSSTAGAPTVAQLNDTGDYTMPTADDKAGKKTLWGTQPKTSKSTASSNVDLDTITDDYIYTYNLDALFDSLYTFPISEFTLGLPLGITPGDFLVTLTPEGWIFEFIDGVITPNGKEIDEGEVVSPSLLRFFTPDPWTFGAYPGDNFLFELMSPHPPIIKRAFTNSPDFDSDESALQVPNPPHASIPTLNQWGMIMLILLLLTVGVIFIYKRQTSLALAGVKFEGEISVPKQKLFDKKLFLKVYAIVLLIGIVVLLLAFWYYGRLESADPIGTIVSAGIVAYMVHLLIQMKSKA